MDRKAATFEGGPGYGEVGAVGVNPEKSLRAKGITYLGEVKFSFDDHTVEEQNPFSPSLRSRQAKKGINFGNIDISQLREGDPLVRFESIKPVNKRERDSCVICHVTLLKPFNEGHIKGIGYKFYPITQDELDARRLLQILPEGLGKDAKLQITKEFTSPAAAAKAAGASRGAADMNGGYKNNLKNKKKSKKNKKNKKYNRNKATMKIKQKNKRKTRTKKMKMKKYKN